MRFTLEKKAQSIIQCKNRRNAVCTFITEDMESILLSIVFVVWPGCLIQDLISKPQLELVTPFYKLSML